MKIAELLHDHPKKLIFIFILPTMIGQIVFAFGRILEKVFLGQALGNEAIAIVGVTFPIFKILVGVSMWIRSGAGATISIALGDNRKEYAEKVLGTAIVFLVLVSFVLTLILLFFLDPILLAIGANETILPMASLYMKVTLVGLVINFLAFGVSFLIRSEGHPFSGMWMLVSGSVLNSLLSFIFIENMNLGIFGASLAPVLGNVLTVILIVWHFFKSRNRNLNLKWKHLKLEIPILKRILPIGFPLFVMMAGGSIVGVVTNILLKEQDNVIYLGIMGGFTFSFLFIEMIITGFYYGFQPLFGYSYGQKNIKKLKIYLKNALLLSTLVSTIAFVVIFSYPEKIASLFAKNNSMVIPLTLPLMKLFFICLPVIGFNILGIYFFQSIGKGKKAFILFFLQKFLVLVGIFVFPMILGIEGVFISFSISEYILFGIVSFMLYKELKSLTNNYSNFNDMSNSNAKTNLLQ